MAQSPRSDARNRYNANFHSSIFETSPQPTRTAFVPAGKRRDQTTSEMFGSYDEKDLRGMPKTFVPKDNGLTAQQMKQHFLSSEVLPCSGYPARAPEPSPRLLARQAAAAAATAAGPEGDAEEQVDSRARRHEELSSKLFGRKTPEVAAEQGHTRGTRLTPNDFKWHSHPEAVRSPRGGEQVSHARRAYQEKCSTVFDHRSPEVPDDLTERRLAREEADKAEMQRRSNAHYSDLFGRSAHAEAVGQLQQQQQQQQQESSSRRPRAQANPADQIAVQQDWMDSKTELMGGPRSNRPEHPALRKSDELHRNRIFGEQESSWQPPEKLDSLTYDNSHKLRNALGQTTQQIHQAHMRTSLQPREFYEEAESTKQWEVVELHVSGLPRDADDKKVKQLCQGFDLQLVKVVVDTDPVSNRCMGRGKIMVRHNAQQESLAGLVHKLEECRLRVEV